MATASFEPIAEIDGKLALARVTCADGEAISLAEVGALIAKSGARWTTLAETCAYWQNRRDNQMPAWLIVAACPDLPGGVCAVLQEYPNTRQHGLSLAEHGKIDRYHWPHDEAKRLFLVSLA